MRIITFLVTDYFYVCRDAEDAVYGRDGYDYDGYRLRVEFPRSGRGGGRGGGGGVGAPRGRYGPPSRRSEYRVIVSGEGMGSITSLSCSIGCFHTWSRLKFNCSHPLDFTLYLFLFFKFISNHGMSAAVFLPLSLGNDERKGGNMLTSLLYLGF